MTDCKICDGMGWVCEEHRDQPWEHDDCGGAGAACVCNPHKAIQWAEIYAEVRPDEPPH